MLLFSQVPRVSSPKHSKVRRDWRQQAWMPVGARPGWAPNSAVAETKSRSSKTALPCFAQARRLSEAPMARCWQRYSQRKKKKKKGLGNV
jgi:hypothetical protein